MGMELRPPTYKPCLLTTTLLWLTFMEQWSILSNIIYYVQHRKNPKNSHSTIVKPINSNRTVKEIKGRNVNKSLLKVNLIDIWDRLKEKYLDIYEGIKPEILDITRFEENLDLSMTYLGKINMTHSDNLTVEERFLITE